MKQPNLNDRVKIIVNDSTRIQKFYDKLFNLELNKKMINLKLATQEDYDNAPDMGMRCFDLMFNDKNEITLKSYIDSSELLKHAIKKTIDFINKEINNKNKKNGPIVLNGIHVTIDDPSGKPISDLKCGFAFSEDMPIEKNKLLLNFLTNYLKN